MIYVLWTLQVLLALLFLFAGGFKLIIPAADLEAQAKMPGLFLKFIAVCEVLGGLGLVLPGLTRIKPGLTPLAAAGLVIIMIGATVTGLRSGDVKTAVMPFIVGVLLAFVGYARWRVAPHAEGGRGPALQRAR